MDSFEENLMVALDRASSERAVFDALWMAARLLGFDHLAYGLRLAIPVSDPAILTLNSYSSAWQRRYIEAGYLQVDPTVRHAHRNTEPLVWTDMLFAGSRPFWEDAQAHGLRVGWAQSSLDGFGVGGMLTLSRGGDKMSIAELEANEPKFRWLVQAAHLSLSRLMQKRHVPALQEELTPREREVLKWTADGKTSSEISEIMNISMPTVNFHIGNAVLKLNVTNKTAAVVQALMRGLLH